MINALMALLVCCHQNRSFLYFCAMFENSANRTDLSSMGEFGLIDHIAQHFTPAQASTLKGIGDDAAVIAGNDQLTVVTTDMLAEGVHFDLAYMPLKHLGYKAVTVNLSDIYAMNATPRQITISIALSNRFSLEAIEEFYVGVGLACKKYGVDLVGGDTTSSQSGLVISVTAIGTVDKDHIVYRSGAKVNDLLCVSGNLGAAYMGLQILKREKKVFQENPQIQPDLEGHDYILERQLKPEARKDTVDALQKAGVVPTAMIDISDGLSSDVLHLCKHSKVACHIYEEKLPMDQGAFDSALDFNLSPVTCMMNGGEDYELLFTISPADYDKVKEIKDVVVIGHVTEGDTQAFLVDKSGQLHEVVAQGWNALN